MMIFLLEPNIHSPVIVDEKGERVHKLRGYVVPSESTVQLNPRLRATDGDAMGRASMLIAAFSTVFKMFVVQSSSNLV